MTPEELGKLVEDGVVVGVMAAAEAIKATETLRCAALTRELAESDEAIECGDGTDWCSNLLLQHANDILRTGGLKAEQPDAKMKR